MGQQKKYKKQIPHRDKEYGRTNNSVKLPVTYDKIQGAWADIGWRLEESWGLRGSGIQGVYWMGGILDQRKNSRNTKHKWEVTSSYASSPSPVS